MAPAAPLSFDTTGLLQALQAATLPQQNAQSDWFMDTDASGHMTGDSVKNLISVHKFTTDNACSIEFDPFGFSIKDLHSKTEIMRSNSDGDLYPLHPRRQSNKAMALQASSTSTKLWHRHLGHPGHQCLDSILSQFSVSSRNKDTHVCDACQKGRHVHLPFSTSTTVTYFPFQLVHCDPWTSPLASFTGFKYYLVVLDDFSHYMWTFPLRHKSDANTTIQNFYALFINSTLRQFLTTRGVTYRLSCPYIFAQNGKAERALRTINDVLRTLLFQAHLSPKYWVEALHTATYLINRCPSKPIQLRMPYQVLFGQESDYSHLKVFGCLCYPNLSSTMAHKLAPQSAPCVFLGYPLEHKGYRCLDLKTRKIITSRHVIFDEDVFPFCTLEPTPPPATANPGESNSTLLPGPPLTSYPGIRAPPQHAPPPEPPGADSNGPAPAPASLAPASATTSAAPTEQSAASSPALPHGTSTTSVTRTTPASVLRYASPEICLVPKPVGANVISGKWIFRHKLNRDGSLARYKARWVVRGFKQEHGVDYEETFSPVIKPATIRTVLSIATSAAWPIHQLDVKNAFLHGNLSETVYCDQPSGFQDPSKPSHVCKLNKSLYGLKQAPHTWFLRFKNYLYTLSFRASRADTSLFILHNSQHCAYLLLWLLDHIITQLCHEFYMSDLGPLQHFLGIHVTPTAGGIFLGQEQYALELLQHAGMEHCNPISTPIDTRAKLSINDGHPVPNPTKYRSIAGALQYLTLTRPDLQYAVQQACLFMHAPRTSHYQLLKRILRYVKGTISYGLHISWSSNHELLAYSDADWAGCPDTRRSTSGYCVFYGDNLVSWSSKRQQTVSPSSAEAEYRAVANALKPVGSDNSCKNCIVPHQKQLWYFVTTSARNISQPTQFNINGQSTLKLIFISSMTKLPWASMPMFLPRDYHQRFFASSETTCTSGNVQVEGGCWRTLVYMY
ncbi:LOW QUALITY PROTEIN: hypothetical protein U9M48_028692 [Paspalum notatum var. saurae]|uniref:Integrase catalytic domain-containing protein n=1 Tax=Paspalum notatum var. saurae TaxID=547442 RepID=A0AAQ3TX71_PASNO